MATLAFKVLVVTIAIATCQVMAGSNNRNNSENKECRGKVREGESCQDGTGVCTRVGEPGKRYGLMECVLVPKQIGDAVYSPGYPGNYYNSLDWEQCWSSPSATTITVVLGKLPLSIARFYPEEPNVIIYTGNLTQRKLTFPFIEVECRGYRTVCDDPHYCPYDYIRIDKNDDGTYEIEKLCSTHTDYVYESSSNNVCMLFHSDSEASYGGFKVLATYI